MNAACVVMIYTLYFTAGYAQPYMKSRFVYDNHVIAEFRKAAECLAAGRATGRYHEIPSPPGPDYTDVIGTYICLMRPWNARRDADGGWVGGDYGEPCVDSREPPDGKPVAMLVAR